MRNRSALRSVLPLLALLLSTTPSLAAAGWFPNGNAVCRAPGEQVDVSIVSDGSGGAFVVWRDQRRGSTLNDLFATHVLADGSTAAGWPVDGLALSQSGAVGRPWPVASGNGGLLVFWLDGQTSAKYMQRVNGAGEFAAGFPANGLQLPIAGQNTFSGSPFQAVSDGAGGAYLMWAFAPAIDRAELKLTRVTGGGAAAQGFDLGGVTSTTATFGFNRWEFLQLTADPSGGAWLSEITSFGLPGGRSLNGYRWKLEADGTLEPVLVLTPDGSNSQIIGEYASVNPLSGAADGSGGAFSAWRIGGSSGPAQYLKHHSSAGTDLAPLASAPVLDALIPDGAGGVYLFGAPIGLNQLELHRRDALGAAPAGWASGAIVSTSGGYLALEPLRVGGRVITCWTAGDPSTADLMASSIEADGTLSPGWPVGGTTVSNAAGLQLLGGVLHSGGIAAGSDNDAFVAWQDTRSGGSDVYVARLGANGPVVDARIEAELTVAPRQLDRLQHGRWLKAWIEPPMPYLASRIDVASLRINGSVPVAAGSQVRFTDHDRDGIAELLVRFDRDAVAATLPAIGPQIIEVTGTIDGQPLVAADTLLGDPGVIVTPAAGMRLPPGTVTQLAWQLPEGMTTANVALLVSLDAGRTWETITPEIPAGTPLDWSAPNRRTDHALIAVAMGDPSESAAELMDGVLGVSPEFVIGSTLGVDGGPAVALALRRSTPNPQSSRSVRLDLALASDAPARVELIDVTGRTRWSEELTGLGAGSHTLSMAPRGAVSPGLYFVRLTQGTREARLRLTILD